MTDRAVAQLRKIQARHAAGETRTWQDGKQHTVCAYCKNIAGMRYVTWPCPDRQNADKGLKGAPDA